MANTRSVDEHHPTGIEPAASEPTASAPTASAPAAWTPTLFDTQPVAIDPTFAGLRRIDLRHGAWIDHLPGWLHGATAVFDDLVAHVPWRGGQQLMYGRLVDNPRLSNFGRQAVEGCDLARPVIDAMATQLSTRYRVLLHNVGLNYYRDGQDSVAWHGDRVARDRDRAVIAIVSVGGHRPFRLRPKEGGETLELIVGGGDLLVMGGTCQRTWRHSVPKVRHAPPRVSISFRHDY